MGRDTTAHRRMAAKRSREKAAGLRRLNVAIEPVVFDKLAELMKQNNCSSQARLVELLIMNSPIVSSSQKATKRHNEIAGNAVKVKSKQAVKKLESIKLQKKSAAKKMKAKIVEVKVKQEIPSAQMSLFD